MAETRSRISHDAGFWVVAVCFTLVMAYSTVPTPLYPLYQQQDGFPVSVVTVVFLVSIPIAVFVSGAAARWSWMSLAILAPLSAREAVGRRTGIDRVAASSSRVSFAQASSSRAPLWQAAGIVGLIALIAAATLPLIAPILSLPL